MLQLETYDSALDVAQFVAYTPYGAISHLNFVSEVRDHNAQASRRQKMSSDCCQTSPWRLAMKLHPGQMTVWAQSAGCLDAFYPADVMFHVFFNWKGCVPTSVLFRCHLLTGSNLLWWQCNHPSAWEGHEQELGTLCTLAVYTSDGIPR